MKKDVAIDVIYEDNHLLVVQKPANMLVQADSTSDIDLLTLLKQYLKEKYNKLGNVYLGLVHRLDRPVGGVMVFAKTSKAAARLSEQVKAQRLHKEYLAVTCGIPNNPKMRLENYLFKDAKTNTVRVVDKSFVGGKLAILDYELKAIYDNAFSLVCVQLHTGRPHQIRVQLQNIDLPLYGDQRYNKSSRAGEQIALFAYKLGFFHPITNEYLEFEAKVPWNTKPWQWFAGCNL